MAAGGGGAWKVAYADFVTAMMAFFLVMWICGQDQSVKRAVSYYFNDPFNSRIGNSRKHSKVGSLSEIENTGNVPSAESVSMGRGTNAYTMSDEVSLATKLVGDWLSRSKEALTYWKEQAQKRREAALRGTRNSDKARAMEIASLELTRQLKQEMVRDITSNSTGLSRDLLLEIAAKVNWAQLAEDLLED